MIRLIRQEFYRLGKNSLMLGALVMVLCISVVVVGQSAPISLTAKGADFADIQSYMEILGYEIESVAEYDNWFQNMCFRTIVQNTQFMFWIGVLLAGFLIGESFIDRTIAVPIAYGYTRTVVYTAKLAAYFIFALIFSFLSRLATWIIFAHGWTNVSAMEIVQLFIFRALCDIGIVSIPFLIVFFCRDLVKTMTLSVGYAMIFTNSLNKTQAGNFFEEILWHHPVFYYRKMALYGSSNCEGIILSATLIFAVTVALSFYIFHKLELE